MAFRLAANPTRIPTRAKCWEAIRNVRVESEGRASRVVSVASRGEWRHLGAGPWFLSDLSDLPTRPEEICSFSESGRVGRVGRFETQPRLVWAEHQRPLNLPPSKKPGTPIPVAAPSLPNDVGLSCIRGTSARSRSIPRRSPILLGPARCTSAASYPRLQPKRRTLVISSLSAISTLLANRDANRPRQPHHAETTGKYRTS